MTRRGLAALAVLAALLSGCTPLKEWVHNGFRVGPNFHEPPVQVASRWIDAEDPRLIQGPADDGDWWAVFQDPVLDSLIETAHRQNLDLKTVGTRVLQAQAQRNIEAGNLFPQSQNAIGDYAHAQISRNLNIFNNPRGCRCRPISTSGRRDSTPRGSWISGDGSAGPSSRPMPIATRRSKPTTRPWSRWPATSPPVTSRSARSRSASPTPAATSRSSAGR